MSDSEIRADESTIDEFVKKFRQICGATLAPGELEAVFEALRANVMLEGCKFSVESDILDTLDEIGQMASEFPEDQRQDILYFFFNVLFNRSYLADPPGNIAALEVELCTLIDPPWLPKVPFTGLN